MHHGSATAAPAELPPSGPVYQVYKRRFWGLAQLVLLNIVVSWDVGSLSAASKNVHSSDTRRRLVVNIFLDIDYCG